MIGNLFEKTSSENRAALAIFISCGDPNMDFTKKLVRKICSSGADIIELGVPFSDPMADGKVIQNSSSRALGGGANLQKILDMVKVLRDEGIDKKFVLFSYVNPILAFGIERAAQLSAEAGIDAWLIVDAPIEESLEFKIPAEKFGIDYIALASATTPLERLQRISKSASGFLYYATVAGVTGARKSLPRDFISRLESVRKFSSLPVASGFGISNEVLANEAARYSDAVVVGSAFVDLAHCEYEKNGADFALSACGDFVASLAKAMKR